MFERYRTFGSTGPELNHIEFWVLNCGRDVVSYVAVDWDNERNKTLTSQ